VLQVVDTRYRAIELLGSGGMAEVYLAHDAVLDREVALKVLSRRYADDDEVIERFRSEARSAAALSHPNVVSIYDRGETEDGTYYIVMEYVAGGTLKEQILREGPFLPHTAAAVATQVAEALKEAHRRGIVHRDVKPQNILVTESGDVKVADFGIARAASSSSLTRTGIVLGSVHYMSPEQAIGLPIDPRSDLYSLGVVLYEMLTGEPPYDAENPISIAMKHVDGRLRPPQEVDPSISEGMNAITVRLLAKDPEERYPDVASLVKDLDRVGQGLRPTADTMCLMVEAVAQTGGDGRPAAFRESRAGAQSLSAPRRQKKRRQRMLTLIVVAVLFAALALLETMGSGLWQDLLEWSDVPVTEASSLVEVPDVTGQDIEEASQTLRDVGLKVDPEHDTVKSDEPEGTVVSTDPPAGSEAKEGTSVNITVSRGTPKERTAGLNAPTGNGTAPVLAATMPNTRQSDSSPVLSPTPAPQQSDLEQSAEDEKQVVVEDRREIRNEVQEEKGEIRQRAHQAAEEIQEKGQGRAENAREDRADD
jgi:tRNA A-37 threonylcarbamoyl transferase component Bud32/cytoskeletal protein RodZ